MLAASAAALPALLGIAGCRSSDLFTGPDPLASRPPLAPDVIALQAAIESEQGMIRLYAAATGGTGAAAGSSRSQQVLLEGMAAQHRQHLGQLQARLVVPSGQASPSASATAGAGPVTAARLRAAEQASAAALMQRLATADPALAQLFASIAASDATHAVALGG